MSETDQYDFTPLADAVTSLSSDFNTGTKTVRVQDPLAEVSASGIPGGLDHGPRTVVTVALLGTSQEMWCEEVGAERLREMGESEKRLAEDLQEWLFDEVNLEGDLQVVFRLEEIQEDRVEFKASIPRPK